MSVSVPKRVSLDIAKVFWALRSFFISCNSIYLVRCVTLEGYIYTHILLKVSRIFFRILRTMASKRVKRDCRGGVENKPNTATEDRLSQLPDPLIHYIFSFLPTFYIVQMSILSKRWRRMWVSTPFIYLEDFCGINKKAKNRKRFLKFVHNKVWVWLILLIWKHL